MFIVTLVHLNDFLLVNIAVKLALVVIVLFARTLEQLWH